MGFARNILCLNVPNVQGAFHGRRDAAVYWTRTLFRVISDVQTRSLAPRPQLALPLGLPQGCRLKKSVLIQESPVCVLVTHLALGLVEGVWLR